LSARTPRSSSPDPAPGTAWATPARAGTPPPRGQAPGPRGPGPAGLRLVLARGDTPLSRGQAPGPYGPQPPARSSVTGPWPRPVRPRPPHRLQCGLGRNAAYRWRAGSPADHRLATEWAVEGQADRCRMCSRWKLWAQIFCVYFGNSRQRVGLQADGDASFACHPQPGDQTCGMMVESGTAGPAGTGSHDPKACGADVRPGSALAVCGEAGTHRDAAFEWRGRALPYLCGRGGQWRGDDETLWAAPVPVLTDAMAEGHR